MKSGRKEEREGKREKEGKENDHALKIKVAVKNRLENTSKPHTRTKTHQLLFLLSSSLFPIPSKTDHHHYHYPQSVGKQKGRVSRLRKKLGQTRGTLFLYLLLYFSSSSLLRPFISFHFQLTLGPHLGRKTKTLARTHFSQTRGQ